MGREYLKYLIMLKIDSKQHFFKETILESYFVLYHIQSIQNRILVDELDFFVP